jgi:hypothetical protein
MIPAILEKASFGSATVVLFLSGRLNAQMLAAGVLDLFLGGLFVAAYIRTAPRSGSSP